MVGLEPERLLEAGDRFIEAAGVTKHRAKAVLKIGAVRRKLDRAPKGGQRIGLAADSVEDVGEIVMGLGERRFDGDRLADEPLRVESRAALEEEEAEEAHRLGMAWIFGKGASIEPL